MSPYFRKNPGFTLPELLVSIGILAVITAIIVSNQANYTNMSALTNLADEIGLGISQAQAYGSGVREFSPGSGEFSASYGLTFSLRTSPANSGSPTAYLYFADRDPDGAGAGLPNMFYNGDWTCATGGANECLQKVNISGGNIIESICLVLNTGGENCSAQIRADISFNRPDTEAQIIFFDSGGVQIVDATMIGAKIVLRSPSGSNKSVYVYNTGQVSVQ